MDPDEAARRTAINLMRLNEAIEMRDAEHYSMRPAGNGQTVREHRQSIIRSFYKRWFTSKALRRIP